MLRLLLRSVYWLGWIVVLILIASAMARAGA